MASFYLSAFSIQAREKNIVSPLVEETKVEFTGSSVSTAVVICNSSREKKGQVEQQHYKMKLLPMKQFPLSPVRTMVNDGDSLESSMGAI